MGFTCIYGSLYENQTHFQKTVLTITKFTQSSHCVQSFKQIGSVEARKILQETTGLAEKRVSEKIAFKVLVH